MGPAQVESAVTDICLIQSMVKWQSVLRLLEFPAVQDAPIIVEGSLCQGIVEWVICTKLPCGDEPSDQASFLTVDQRMGSTVPCSSLTLNEAEQIDQQYNVTHVMNNMLKPPPHDDLSFID